MRGLLKFNLVAKIVIILMILLIDRLYVKDTCLNCGQKHIMIFKFIAVIINVLTLPVGLIAQLMEHCTGIAEIMALNPVQAWIFSGFLFLLLK